MKTETEGRPGPMGCKVNGTDGASGAPVCGMAVAFGGAGAGTRPLRAGAATMALVLLAGGGAAREPRFRRPTDLDRGASARATAAAHVPRPSPGFDAPVMEGDPLRKGTELAGIQLHECASATMVFATAAHSIHALRRLALTTEQDTA